MHRVLGSNKVVQDLYSWPKNYLILACKSDIRWTVISGLEPWDTLLLALEGKTQLGLSRPDKGESWCDSGQCAGVNSMGAGLVTLPLVSWS
jgi:hypothetical protein